jgi:hypothetical protein
MKSSSIWPERGVDPAGTDKREFDGTENIEQKLGGLLLVTEGGHTG